MADKKGKTTTNAKRLTKNNLELFAEIPAEPENNFAISLEKLALKKSANNEVFEHIKDTFEIEMDNEIFKQNNADQVKGNTTKSEYTNCDKNRNGSPSFIQKFLIQDQIFIITVNRGR